MPEPGRRGVQAIRSQDVALALLVCALMLVGTLVSLDDFEISVPEGRTRWLPGPAGLTLVVTGSLVLALRLVAAVPVLAVATIASLAYSAIGYRPAPLPLAVLVAVYTVAVVSRPVVAGAAAVACVLSVTLVGAAGWLPLTDDQYYTDLISVVGAAMLGYGVALARARAVWAEQRAAALAEQEEGRLRAAVAREQSRMAREVHDIVAHDVSVMVAQAAAAGRVFAAHPETAADALTSIEKVGRDALDGLRRLVWLLRTGAADGEPGNVAPGSGQRSPLPQLDQLPWLVEQVRRAGLPVVLTVLGDAYRLPATVELNAYRIVQEALTNSLRHGARTGATVTLDYRGDSLRVDVEDRQGETAAGSTASGRTGGFGLISMQQRAALLGGELEIGRGRDRGFRVAVTLPVTGAPL
jgi:signal transduction histidine kinase